MDVKGLITLCPEVYTSIMLMAMIDDNGAPDRFE